MILAHRSLSIKAKDTPSEPFDLRLPVSVSHLHLFAVVHGAVDFDDQTRFHDSKIDGIAANRMLPPNRETKRPQFPQSLPCHLLRRVRFATKTTCTMDIRIAGQR